MHRTHLGQLGEKGSFGSLKLIDARALDLLEVKPDDVLLEIGTGLGYQAAVLAELAGRGVQRRNHRRARATGNTAAETTQVIRATIYPLDLGPTSIDIN